MTRSIDNLKIHFFALLIALSTLMSSCSLFNSDKYTPPTHVDQTLIMFFPWSTNLLDPYFYYNIEDMLEGIGVNPPSSARILGCLQHAEAGKAEIFELYYDKSTGKSDKMLQKTYSSIDFTTEAGIKTMLNDIKSLSSSDRYSLIVSSHGMGWVPVPTSGESQAMVQRMQSNRISSNEEPLYITRFYGGTTTSTQTNTTTLRDAIANSNIQHLEYLLFDACYMSTIETAYEFRNVTNYIIASPTEIMGYGFPYSSICEYMFGDVDFQSIVDSFQEFYATYSGGPYGTIGVTDCSEVDALAALMSEINTKYTLGVSKLASVQRLDGYDPVIFYDMGSYVSLLCSDETLLNSFNEQLEKTVPYRAHTDRYYANGFGTYPIGTFCGITISDPTLNADDGVISSKLNTEWWKATH